MEQKYGLREEWNIFFFSSVMRVRNSFLAIKKMFVWLKA